MQTPILLIESATDTCSVALADKTTVIAQKICRIPKCHDTVLAPLAESVLKENGIQAKDLSMIGVSEGPGSYMGLRIGVSLAKGIAYSANVKLFGISTLEAIAQCAVENLGGGFDTVVPMIDAGRMEVYTATFDIRLEMTSPVEAKILDKESFAGIMGSKVLFCGNGAPKFGELLRQTHGSLPENITVTDQTPLASGLRFAAYKALEEGKESNLAYFQPFYLKEFIPGKQKKLL